MSSVLLLGPVTEDAHTTTNNLASNWCAGIRDVWSTIQSICTRKKKYRQHSKECMWHQRGHFFMGFNVYDSKVTSGKGGAHVALYRISFDSEVRLSVKCEILK